jgi:hypothetical protein
MMDQGPVTVLARGREVTISADELETELGGEGPCRSLAHVEAVSRANDRERAISRLRRAIASGGAGSAGALTMQAVAGLIRLHATEAAPELRALGERVGGSPGAIARAGAFLVEDGAEALAGQLPQDPLMARHSPQAYVHATRVPPGSAALFAAWVAELQRASTAAGVTAYRAFLGDVAEAAYRTLQFGVEAEALLGENGKSFLLDSICAELPGTTDFLAARGMAWLVGTLEPTDDSVRSAIERARSRFRDPAFSADCDAMLAMRAWPPPPRLR